MTRDVTRAVPRDRGTPGALTDALEANRVDERRRALRGMLRRPLMIARGRDAATFTLVRRHSVWLRDWFARETGWPFRVDAEVARLTKTPADTRDGTRPAVSGSAQHPFSRRRYVLLCLALAGLERADSQITLGRLAEDVVTGCADPELAAAGFTFALDRREEKADLVAAVRVLLDLGVLRKVAGDETAFTTGTGDALYDLDRRVLAGLLVTRRGPSTVVADTLDDRLAAVLEEFVPDVDDARIRARRHNLTRRLLDDPVVYYADLAEDELAYLTNQRLALTRRITEATGLVAEIRAEGIAMVDPDGDLTDVRMPEDGTDGHATLLLAEHLAHAARDHPDRATSVADLYSRMREFADAHRSHWRKDATEPGAEVVLVDRALSRLGALGMLRRVEGEPGSDAPTRVSVVALPALGRFALGDLRDPTGNQGKL